MQLLWQPAAGSPSAIDVDPSVVLLAGYTGRDQDVVRAHVAELASHGISAPEQVPTCYAVPASRLRPTGEVQVASRSSSGEVEFVLWPVGKRVFVGVGSDHTDRELEKTSVLTAKLCCDKPVSAEVWDSAEIRDHWDDLQLVARIPDAAEERVYQQGSLGDLLSLDDLLEEARGRVGELDGTCIFSGTLPVLGGEFVATSSFHTELVDPVLQRKLTRSYRVQQLPALDE